MRCSVAGGHRRGRFALLSSGEEVIDGDEQDGGPETGDEALDLPEEERPPAAKGEAGEDELPGVLHHPPVGEERSGQVVEGKDGRGEEGEGPGDREEGQGLHGAALLSAQAGGGTAADRSFLDSWP